MMAGALLGLAAFALLFLFEACKCSSVKEGRERKNPWFYIGMLLLAAAWVITVIFSGKSPMPWLAIGVALTILAIAWYVKVLGTTSQENTYTENHLKVPVIRTGPYSRTRHPGIWCFAAVAAGITVIAPESWPVNLLFTLINLLYCILQDRYFFPVYIEGYDIYKQEVPFCIPGRKH